MRVPRPLRNGNVSRIFFVVIGAQYHQLLIFISIALQFTFTMLLFHHAIPLFYSIMLQDQWFHDVFNSPGIAGLVLKVLLDLYAVCSLSRVQKESVVY